MSILKTGSRGIVKKFIVLLSLASLMLILIGGVCFALPPGTIIPVTGDSFVAEHYEEKFGIWTRRDNNYGSHPFCGIITEIHDTDANPQWFHGWFENWRVFIERAIFDDAMLYVYCYYLDVEGARNISAYRVTSSSWGENTITWNNQPGLGSLLDTVTITNTGWKILDVGTASSVCIKFDTEYGISDLDNTSNFRYVASFISKEHPVATYEPYFKVK